MGGFFGVVSKKPCVYDLYYGTDYHSHLGARRAGMATFDNGNFSRSIHSIESAYFRNKFESDLGKFTGNSGIGVISDTDSQPILFNSHLGPFALVTVAKINNLKEIESDLLAKGLHFTEFSTTQINQTEVAALLITQGKNFVEGIERVFETIKGSCSLLLLTDKGVIAARDKYGRTPIVVAKRDDAYCVAFESSSYTNLGFETEKFLGPGEIVQITSDSCIQLRKPEKKMQICSFLWVYYGYPSTDYENINVDEMRYRTGYKMGEDDDVNADFVSGIPDSGIGMALGYSESKNIPFRRGIVKYTPTWPRSFMPPDQNIRELVAKMKLIANRSLLKDKSVIFCDDSIVRGTQLRDNVGILYKYGAKEVHMRISCPPLLYACQYINFSASKSEMELITRRCIDELKEKHGSNIADYAESDSPAYCDMVNCVRDKLKISSLKFTKVEDMVKAIGLPKECICTHCFDGTSYGG